MGGEEQRMKEGAAIYIDRLPPLSYCVIEVLGTAIHSTLHHEHRVFRICSPSPSNLSPPDGYHWVPHSTTNYAILILTGCDDQSTDFQVD